MLAGLFDNTLADYLWSKAVILIGPTMATVALQLQVRSILHAHLHVPVSDSTVLCGWV